MWEKPRQFDSNVSNWLVLHTNIYSIGMKCTLNEASKWYVYGQILQTNKQLYQTM